MKLLRLLESFPSNYKAYKVIAKHFTNQDAPNQFTKCLTCYILCKAPRKFGEAIFPSAKCTLRNFALCEQAPLAAYININLLIMG